MFGIDTILNTLLVIAIMYFIWRKLRSIGMFAPFGRYAKAVIGEVMGGDDNDLFGIERGL